MLADRVSVVDNRLIRLAPLHALMLLNAETRDICGLLPRTKSAWSQVKPDLGQFDIEHRLRNRPH